ncbi:MAG: lipid-A-disaccharide synthase [Hyphomicrobiales bacterium]|jgi:lipid-A-disaccharide synthase|nr:lipid-A-disaccharide synthase [Hyphomicrobiales bacterium]
MTALKLALVAAEESGDVLGGALMAALKAQHPDTSFGGVGGRAMESQGAQSPFDIADLSIIGVAAIPRRLPMILRRIRETADAVIAARPDALIIIDSPDFTHRVARRVRKAAPTIPIINYAPPQVWAWRPGRARAMRAYVDEVLAILPFEPAAFARLDGPHCTYVGHPLAERIGDLRPSAEDARRRNADPPTVLVLPGSRGSEIRRLADIFGAAIANAAERAGPFDLALPTLPHIAAQVASATADWPVRPRIVTGAAEKHAAFRAARAALAASGTVTLELALARVPTVAAYRIPAWEGALFRMLASIDTVILANLVLGENVVPEYLQSQCTADGLAAGLVSILAESPQRQRQLDAFGRLDTIMGLGGEPPSARAAHAVLELIARRGASGALPSSAGSC